MENFAERWKRVEMMLEGRFEKKPNLEAILYLIGINEFGHLPEKKFSKEQKQDLMHIAVCHLLSSQDYYELVGHDEEGWPHYSEIKDRPKMTMIEQEWMLKECIINYFEK